MLNKFCFQSSPPIHVPTPRELHDEFPTTPEHLAFIEHSRSAIKHVMEGTDNRFLVIMGPCSIHDTTAAEEYATKLSTLAKETADRLLLVMRVYFEKPRTKIGWKGLVHDPYLDGTHDIITGMKWTRQLLLKLTTLQVPVACEFLDLSSPQYFGDLISWGSIGARSSSSQIHRQIASGLPMTVGFKNNTDGNIDIAINGIISARFPHSFIMLNDHGQPIQVDTPGNPYSHVVLRGGTKPNYDPKCIAQTLQNLEDLGIPPRIVVDCSHGNSNRDHHRQPHVFQSVINQYLEGNRNIRGAMLESNLYAGKQKISSQMKYGMSITDPCIDWSATENLIRWAYETMNFEYSKNCEELMIRTT